MPIENFQPSPTPPPTAAPAEDAPAPLVTRAPMGGSFRLFRFFGITVFLHFSWFLLAVYGIQSRREYYASIYGPVAEYVTLFAIVLLHEFGHAFACRSVGGIANRIILWPFGGVAYVDPPQRPGAMLWSIVAGPLVNVVLLLPLYFADRAAMSTASDFAVYVHAVFYIDVALLVFNMLPLYPLDGGQILRSLLWFVIGRTWSLLVAASIGIAGASAFILVCLWGYLHGSRGSLWLCILAGLGLYQCWRALKYALSLRRLEQIPRRTELACPACGVSPPALPIWKCPGCENAIDIFATAGVCPKCGSRAQIIPCIACGQPIPFPMWQRDALRHPITASLNPAGFQYADSLANKSQSP